MGQYVVRDLLAHGHEVLGVDINMPARRSATFLRVDLTEPGEVYQALAAVRAEAVVHMGAWANAGIVPDTRTYGDNVQGTFNVFRACADMGIRRIVSASSAQVYGFHLAPPIYLPADELHPLRPGNSYALAKMAGEQAADYFVSNHGLSILSFRIMGARSPAQIPDDIERTRQDPARNGGQLWSRADARDIAYACRLAIEKDSVASGPYNITGGLVLADPAEQLVKRYFADRTEVRADLGTYPSPLSCARAEAEFGYRPQYLWSETQQYPES